MPAPIHAPGSIQGGSIQVVGPIQVVGAGPEGMAAAARLSKLGHRVRLLEQNPEPGGRLGGHTAELAEGAFAWDDGPATLLVPAALRDLFRKSGRPWESVGELRLTETEHRFADGSSLRLPGGSRAGQLRAVDALAPGLGSSWCDFVLGCSTDWEMLRRGLFERSYAARLDPELDRLVATDTSLAERVGSLPDPRLRSLAAVEARLEGHLPDRAPHWLALLSYLEQRLGRWRVVGGTPALSQALVDRLAQRRVEVRTGQRVDSPLQALEDAAAVVWATGESPAHIGPPLAGRDADRGQHGWFDRGRRLLGAAPRRARSRDDSTNQSAGQPANYSGARPANQPRVLRRVHLAIEDSWPAERIVLHADEPVEITVGPQAPARHTALTLTTWARLDPVAVAEEYGVSLGERIRYRRETEFVADPSMTWSSPTTPANQLGPHTTAERIWRANPQMTPGLGLAGAWLAAAQVAEAIGRA